MGINPALVNLAKQTVWKQASAEKQGFQPPGGGGADPGAAMGANPPPMPPMGGMPPGGGAPGMPAPPPGGGGAPGMPAPAPSTAAPGAVDPMTGQPMAGAAPAQQKMKPEQMMQIIDFRLYNMQQQITALLNHAGVTIPPGALVTPPGQMSPPPEAAMPGGPQDPTQQAGAQSGGGASAISPIEPMQGASPELAMAGGGGGGGGGKEAQFILDPTKLPSNFLRKKELAAFLKEANAQAPVGYRVALQKLGEEGTVDEAGPKVSPPSKALNVPGAPDTTPSLRPHPNSTAGGSKDPEPVLDGEMPDAKAAAFGAMLAEDAEPSNGVGSPVARTLPQPKTASLWNASPLSTNAAAVAAMIRSRTQAVPA